MARYLSEIKINENVTVVNVLGEGLLKRRLLDMGITPGTEIVLKKKAPLGDPLQFYLRGYNLSLRQSEAKLVVIE
jgi:Fe2+ transport system protein FeoA